jgi:hypothetical protein
MRASDRGKRGRQAMSTESYGKKGTIKGIQAIKPDKKIQFLVMGGACLVGYGNGRRRASNGRMGNSRERIRIIQQMNGT